MNKVLTFFIGLSLIIAVSCSSEKKQTEASEEPETNERLENKAAKEAEKSEITGYASLDELSKEVVESLRNNDYEDYLTHVMTPRMEKTVSKEIEKKDMRDYFLGEFGFSLEREKEEFDNLVNYFKERNISLDSINFEEVEVIDYHHDEYAPLTLKEVMIIVPHEYDVLLIYTAIKIKDRWYLTSELEV